MIKQVLKDLINPKAFENLIGYSANYRLNLFYIVTLHIVLSLSGVITAVITKNMIDAAIGGEIPDAIRFGIVLAILFLIGLYLSNFSMMYSAKVRESMRNKLQLDFLRSIFQKRWMYLNNYKTGDILTRINTDISYVIDVWIGVFPNLVALIIQLITAYVVLSNFDRTLAFLAFIIAPATFIPGLIIGRKLKIIQQRIQQAESTLNSFINESIHNIIIIKTFNTGSNNIEQTYQYQSDRRDHILNKTRTSAYANFILGLGYQAGFFSALAFGAYRISTGVITFGTFTAFLQLVSQIQYPIDALSRTIPQIIASLSSIERLKEVTDLPDEDETVALTDSNQIVPEKLTIDVINFEYSNNKPILDSISLTISQGERLALLGASGEGKTTLAMVLLGFLRPQSGSISLTFDDDSVIPITSATRKFFSYVPQNNALFSGTIEYNLKLANTTATEDEIFKALTASCAIQFINELPAGIKTFVGENGIGLSEGQLQRICIARALLRNAPILILDEATSALDINTENSIIHGLIAHYPRMTIITITHRNSILKICDRVYILNKGRLEEYSTYMA